MRLPRRHPGRVVLYTTPGCHLCDEAAAALADAGVAYSALDASADPERFLRTPVLEVDGVERADATTPPGSFGRIARSRFRRSAGR